MTIGCNIGLICFKLNWFFYILSRIMQFSPFVWALSYSVRDVFDKFLLIDATYRSRISSDQKRFFISLSLYPLSFFANTPFNWTLPNPKTDTTLYITQGSYSNSLCFLIIHVFLLHNVPLNVLKRIKPFFTPCV